MTQIGSNAQNESVLLQRSVMPKAPYPVLIHVSSRSENPYGVGFKPRTFGNRVLFLLPTPLNPKKETAHTGSELSDSCSVLKTSTQHVTQPV